MKSALAEFLSDQLADCETQWSIGAFGALAEFNREPQEAAAISRSDLSVITSRGGIRISPLQDVRLVASESITHDSWAHRVALCLRDVEGVMARRHVLTELGPDTGGVRDCDREAILFDLGLGTLQVDACVRVCDPAVVTELRAVTGRGVFEAGNPAMRIIVSASPHRVFLSRLGRIEVYQPIPPPNGRSPEGPHTHVLPKLLQHGRTHATTEQIPEELVPCAHLYPAHPTKDVLGRALRFDERRHAAFQAMLRQFGNKDTLDLKYRVIAAIERDVDPSALDIPNDRFARAGVRIALRQLQASREMSPAILAWLQAHDRSQVNPAEIDDADTIHEHA